MITSTNTQNKKKKLKKTILIIAEGLRDANFLKYLQSLYTRTNKYNVIVRNGMGGTADGLVLEAVNTLGIFDNRVTVLDNDKGETEMQRALKLADDHKIKLIKNSPCIEATLLLVLNKKHSEIPKGSGQCKLKYKKEFLNNKKIEEKQDLLSMFPKKVLTLRRKKVKVLNEMILLVEGKVHLI